MKPAATVWQDLWALLHYMVCHGSDFFFGVTCANGLIPPFLGQFGSVKVGIRYSKRQLGPRSRVGAQSEAVEARGTRNLDVACRVSLFRVSPSLLEAGKPT